MRYSMVDNFPALRDFCNNNCIMFTLHAHPEGSRVFIFDKPFYSKYTYDICESELARKYIRGLERELIDKLKDNFGINDSAVEEPKKASDALYREFYGCDITAIERKLKKDLNELRRKYYKFKVTRITFSKRLYDEWKQCFWIGKIKIEVDSIGQWSGLTYLIEFEYEDCNDNRRYYSCNPQRKEMRDFYRDWVTRLTSAEEKPMIPKSSIKNVIFNDPATIVFWYDGIKTVVKCQEGDTFDPEKGLAMAICKKILGSNDSQSNFNDIFKKWLPKEEEKKEPEVVGIIESMENTENGLLVKGKLTKDLSFITTAENISFTPNEALGILGF